MRNRSLGKWKLPQPTDLKDDNEWMPIPRIARTIPFGYELDPEDNNLLKPINIELDLLEQARKYIKQYSYREVANWLSKNSGRDISHVGLMKRIRIEQKRKSNASAQSYLAKRYKEALQKEERLSKERIGRTASSTESLQSA